MKKVYKRSLYVFFPYIVIPYNTTTTITKHVCAPTYYVTKQTISHLVSASKHTYRRLSSKGSIEELLVEDTLDVPKDTLNISNESFEMQEKAPTDISDMSDKTLEVPTNIESLAGKTLEAPADISNISKKTLEAPADISNISKKTLEAPTKIESLKDKTLEAPTKIESLTDKTLETHKKAQIHARSGNSLNISEGVSTQSKIKYVNTEDRKKNNDKQDKSINSLESKKTKDLHVKAEPSKILANDEAGINSNQKHNNRKNSANKPNHISGGERPAKSPTRRPSFLFGLDDNIRKLQETVKTLKDLKANLNRADFIEPNSENTTTNPALQPH
ncbi:hypothetical protein BB561_001735 [Smittium simulii]|uniref:Uncharacterized protein n=1 Tax=Smittium simulii TaxID=133385 RepID=A0A2T9YTC5_9FUNG|nr:hypothetical protein BB561_001735 [Smittium simulii]